MTDPNVPSETPATPATPYTAPAGASPKQSLSLTSFILGLGGLVFSWIPVLGFLAAVAAVVLGFMGKGKEPGAPKWMWLVGIITGFVAIGLSLIFILALVIPLLVFGSAVSSYGY